MLKKTDIDINAIRESLESLKIIASNNEFSDKLLVLGSGKGSVADLKLSKDDEIIRINNEINKHILSEIE